MTTPLLELDCVTKHYPVYKGLLRRRQIGAVRAVDGVSLTLDPGETLAIVGESGCGKSTMARIAMRLIDPTAGTVRFEGRDITGLDRSALQSLRRNMQIVFQDPYASLNPRMTVAELITEPMLVHDLGTPASRQARMRELLERVDLAPYHAARYPHEFSGGQRQRIGIARALALSPKLIVCDEPVSALDVSIQAQVVNLLKDLQKEFGMAYLFISHGLAVVKHVADRVAVMYLGQIVELTNKRELYANPRHPYTQALLSAVPARNPSRPRSWNVLGGDVPSPLNPPGGCRFHTRCPLVRERCRKDVPSLRSIGPEHQAACHFAETVPVFSAATATGEDAPNKLKRLRLYAQRRRMIPELGSSSSSGGDKP